MKLGFEFELNVMGPFYILVAVALVTAAVSIFSTLPDLRGQASQTYTQSDKLVIWSLFTLTLTGGLIVVLLLVPVVRRIFKAFMPSA